MADSIGCDPPAGAVSGRLTVVGRARRALCTAGNWWQLLRFGLVGLSGYVVNLTVFSLLVGVGGAGHKLGATLAFLVAVSNNFAWNRQWTFRAGAGRVHRQAVRFFAVSITGFWVNIALLELLVVGGVAKLPAQALAVATVMPLNFVGNRLWTFRPAALT